MNGWCPSCKCVVEVDRTVSRPRWIQQPPHYDFGQCIEVDLCDAGHAMTALCQGCEQAPSLDGYDDCRRCLEDQGELEPVKRDQVAPVRALVQS